jgi:putative peptidoglycan lipid II flippase
MIVPDLLYKFLSEGLVSGAAVPLFVDLQKDRQKLERALITVLWLGFVFGLFGAGVLVFFASDFCRMLVPGFGLEYLQRMHLMWAVVSFYVLMGIPSGILTSFLNARRLFALPAVGPLLVNLSIICGIFLCDSVEKIVVAVVFGALLQLLWLFYLCYKQTGLWSEKFKVLVFDYGIASDFVRSVLPIASWISILPFIPVYERYLLSMQPVGSVAALNYIEKLFNLPLGILSISAARVVLPELSSLKGAQRKRFLVKILLISSVVIIPVIAVSVIFAEPLVEIVFKRGRFSQADSAVAAGLFASYVYALLPVTLCMILNRGFFAERRYFVPFIAGLTAAGAQFYLGRPMVENFGVNGIGYSAATAYSLQLVVLLFFEFKPSVHKIAGS